MEYTVRAGALFGIPEVLMDLGINPEDIYSKAGIPIDAAHTPDQLICYRKYITLLNLSAERTKRPDFGILLSKHQSFSMLGAIGFAMKEAPDIRTAILDLCTHLHVNAVASTLEEKDGLAIWSLNVIMPSTLDYRQHLILTVSIGAGLIRQLTSPHWHPELVHFEFKTPENPSPFMQFFNCPISFNQEMNALVFNAELLDKKIENPDKEIYQTLHKHLEKKARTAPSNFISEVRTVIIAGLQKENCTLASIARAMSMKPRTFQRKLKAHEHRFSELLEHTRMDMAKRYLQLSDITLTQISEMLGYAEQATFSRSFKKNTGQTPSQWRKRNT